MLEIGDLKVPYFLLLLTNNENYPRKGVIIQLFVKITAPKLSFAKFLRL